MFAGDLLRQLKSYWWLFALGILLATPWPRRFYEKYRATPLVWLPLFALDRVWVRPRHTLLAFAAHRTPAARQASDHLPVKAIIVPGPPRPGPDVGPLPAAARQ